MTPKEYLDRYTYLKFSDPLTRNKLEGGISNYGSGWDSRNGNAGAGKKMQMEYQFFAQALRAAHHGNAHTPCGKKFFFDQKPLGDIASTEDFYTESFINSFNGKGSPDEITDTLRLAVAIGRVGTNQDAAGQQPARPTAQAYATDFITLDCNGLVGNYYGGDPSASIEHYANAGRSRKSAATIQVGDAVVTHCEAYKFEHVGLIQECSFMGSTAKIRLVEWGWFGGEDVHYSKEPKSYEIKQGPDKRFGFGWETNSNHNKSVKSFRYVFGPPPNIESRGW